MIPKKFDYFLPSTVEEAISILKETEESKVLAGGQSLLALMKLRLASPPALVDISRLSDELAYVRNAADHVAIGALTTHDTIEHDETLKREFTILSEAASKIGDQQIRNRGTIGGSCCHADPSADMPTALLAVDPQFVAKGIARERLIPAAEFFADTFTVSLEKGELLVEVRLMHLPPHTGSAYMKHSLREGDFAIVGVGAVVSTDGGERCVDARISLGAVGPTPLRASKAESYLRGKVLDESTIAEASAIAQEGLKPTADIHGSSEYRREMVKVFTSRTLNLAMSRAK
jgi:aerobic carbon-monoxide dehydrogenase medium subunit